MMFRETKDGGYKLQKVIYIPAIEEHFALIEYKHGYWLVFNAAYETLEVRKLSELIQHESMLETDLEYMTLNNVPEHLKNVIEFKILDTLKRHITVNTSLNGSPTAFYHDLLNTIKAAEVNGAFTKEYKATDIQHDLENLIKKLKNYTT